MNDSTRCETAAHDLAAFLFAGAVSLGHAVEVGGIPEVDTRGDVWWWKVLRCGCVVMCSPVGTGSVLCDYPDPPSLKATRSAAKGRQ
jgi:hypothetical protein